jgi:hypothetical protein
MCCFSEFASEEKAQYHGSLIQEPNGTPKKKKKTSPQLGCFSLWLAETNKMEM